MNIRLALTAACLALPTVVQAGCSTSATGARCVSVPAGPTQIGLMALGGSAASGSEAAPLVAVGDVLRRGQYSILMNADYYGLPAVSDGWVYMRIGADVFRVDWSSQQVLERVTDRAAANF